MGVQKENIGEIGRNIVGKKDAAEQRLIITDPLTAVFIYGAKINPRRHSGSVIIERIGEDWVLSKSESVSELSESIKLPDKNMEALD